MSITLAGSSFQLKNPLLYRWIYYLTASLMYAAVLLRTVIGFPESPFFGLLMVLLLAWLIIFLGNELFARDLGRVSTLLVILQMLIILALLLKSYSIRSDLFAFLFSVTGMQAMRRHSPKFTGALIGSAALMTFLSLFELFGTLQALALTFVYTALNAFLANYIWTTRQGLAIQERHEALAAELQEANSRLDSYTRQIQELTINRERQHLARELHDSVTQTIFSMTLATQTARMAMKRDKPQVAAHLERLDYLAQSALSEMQALVSQVAPENQPENFLEALKEHLAERERVDSLKIVLEVQGDQSLTIAEETGLYRIAQEALNNIVKHAHTKTAILRLHLKEPFAMEIEDHGVGFDRNQITSSEKIGIAGMGERAAEIGWFFEMKSTPGQGTLIRVEKGTGRNDQER